MTRKARQFKVILFLLAKSIKRTAKQYPAFREHLKEKRLTVQLRNRDGTIGRYYSFMDGELISRAGVHPNPDVDLFWETADLGAELLTHPVNWQARVDAMKNFRVGMAGPDELTDWFMETVSLVQSADIVYGGRYGTDMGDGVKRYVNNTNGGPVFVYVKDGRILRITPIEFNASDAEPWTIEARGKRFTPPRKTTLSPHAMTMKSTIYSPDRVLYPMKRVDFDPGGERNPENRGISGYERISWDEATDIVANEIKRIKQQYGPGSILCSHASHHLWGNIGYWISQLHRFMNCIGVTFPVFNPDSWEGWHWGAMHHWGNSARLGGAEPYGTVEDCLRECEMIVFWSSDPESTSGVYQGMEGTIRRQWLKSLGIKVVHIDPYFNHTAAWMGGKWFPVRPATGNAMALAIAYVWITEGLYDKKYIEQRTVGFDKWRDYILGKEDDVAKTPEWQEPETGVPAKDVRALAREWGTKKTYLAAGGPGNMVGGACRCATGNEWARSMVCLVAMQGMGKPGVNMGNLQMGTPVDTKFFFPGYSEGGMSGDLQSTGLSINMYQRMPQLPTSNTVYQVVPRLRIPEAILEGRCEGYATDTRTIEGQFRKIGYPQAGNAPVKMYYKYGGSYIGTMNETNRYVKAYRTERLEFVANQSIWLEGEAQFADVILPACTNFERWDIGEWANCGGYIHHSFTGLNHRVITMQHKCIEPLGESKSDYEIFLELSKKLGFSAIYSEGMRELDWVSRLFEGTDLPRVISWEKFLEKGYYVVPAPPEQRRDPCGFRWYAEGRRKDVPESSPLPADYSGPCGFGLQTQSGKFEFDCSSLKRFAPDDPERPTITKYVPSWEGRHTRDLYEKYPLQLITPHPRYSFHTHNDGKGSFINDIRDHRLFVNGYYYWVARINPRDAEKRSIREKDLIKLFNDRGAVICAARVTHRVRPGTVHSYESSAKYDPVGEPGYSPDRGGCVNLLTSGRPMIKKSHSIAANSCLVQVEKWKEET